jgi:hypothetical protein
MKIPEENADRFLGDILLKPGCGLALKILQVCMSRFSKGREEPSHLSIWDHAPAKTYLMWWCDTVRERRPINLSATGRVQTWRSKLSAQLLPRKVS